MKHRKINDEVFVAEGGVVQVRGADLEFLKEKARSSSKKRARLCTHPGSQDRLHEMLIVLDWETYIRPHRHGCKSESFHMIEGTLDVFLFNEDGTVRDVIALGEPASGKPFFYRLIEDMYHAPVITSPLALFHETTNGPFDRKDTQMAPWAPSEEDATAAAAYMNELRRLGRDWIRPVASRRDCSRSCTPIAG